MFCSHCGAEAAADAGFCGSCGRGLATLRSVSPTLPAAEPRPLPPASLETPVVASHAGQAANWAEAAAKPFLHEGHWYSSRGGVVLRWDAATSLWTLAPPSDLPFFMRRPRFTPLKTPAVWLFVFLGLFAAFTLIGLVADGIQFAVFDRRANGEFLSQADRENTLAFFYAMKVLQYLAVIGIAAMFIWWTRRATCNVRALGAANPEFSPRWSVGWWFIPFANWVQPLRVLNQAWRASDPALPASESDGWRRSRVTPLLAIWWVGYMVGSALWGFAWGSIDEANMSDRDLADISAAVLVLDVLMLPVTALTIWVVAALTQRQARANTRFDSVIH